MIRGHNIMKGYWNRDDATEEAITDDGWFRTGDMAKVDEDGYFFIVDRKKDLIIRGGYNVYPREIEEVLYEHPAIQEAAVVGVPHDELGEEVGAAVVLKEGESLDADELKSYVKEQVAAYKYPRKVWFVDELPEGPDRQDPQARDRGAGEGRSLDRARSAPGTGSPPHRDASRGAPAPGKDQRRNAWPTARRALALTEGSLPTRWYLPREDISAELEPSHHRTTLPFQGRGHPLLGRR